MSAHHTQKNTVILLGFLSASKLHCDDNVTITPDLALAVFRTLLGAITVPRSRFQVGNLRLSDSVTLPSKSLSGHRVEPGFEPRTV